MRTRVNSFRWLLAPCLLTWLACSPKAEDEPSGSGGHSVAGNTAAGATQGGAASGGASSGGASSGGAGLGGAGSGGATSPSGGAPSSGGANANGGTGSAEAGRAAGGATSGAGGTNAGGMNAHGGATSSGGANGNGGASGGTASGGKLGAGGSVSAGGNANTGGASSGGAGASGGSTSTGPKFHVFLLLGQSNMAGYPKAQAADKVEDARVRVLGFDACSATGRETDKWDTAAPPLHECWNGAIGPGDWFAKTLIGKVPSGDTIGLVPCAISGEKIETFMKVGGAKYSWIIQRAKLAQQAGGVIDGMLFHQGESNCGDPAWPGKVNTLVTDLRTDLGLGNVPFLAGELAYSGNCSNHNPLVNKLPTLISNAFVVSASGLAVDPADTQWNLHFGHDEQVTFGKRYAQKMIEALHW